MMSVLSRWLGVRTATAVAVASMGAGPLLLGGEVVSTSASVDWVTAYLWRGMRLTNNPVVQPSLTFSAYGFSLNAWGSVDVTDVNEDDGEGYHLQEIDYTGSYTYAPMEGLDLTGGFVWYTFSGLDSTGELFGTVSLPCVPLSPSLSAYYDVDEADGLYLNAGLKHDIEITEKLGLTLSGGIGYGDDNYHEFYFGEGAHGSESDGLLRATLGYAVTDWLSVSVYGGYAVLLDGAVKRLGEAVYGDDDTVFGGVGVSFNF